MHRQLIRVNSSLIFWPHLSKADCRLPFLFSSPSPFFSPEPLRMFNSSKSEINLQPGDRLHLFCNADGHPAPIISWHRAQLENGVDELLLRNSNELIVLSVSKEMFGTYRCEVRSPLPESVGLVAQKRLVVEFEVTVGKEQSEGKKEYLSCFIQKSSNWYSHRRIRLSFEINFIDWHNEIFTAS